MGMQSTNPRAEVEVNLMKRLLLFLIPALLLLSSSPFETATAQNNKVYWGEDGEDPDETPVVNKIFRANLADVPPTRTPLVTGQPYPDALIVDSNAGKIYWASNDENSLIWRSNLDGTNPETMATNTAFEVIGMTLDLANSKMYFTHVDSWDTPTTGGIGRANLDFSSEPDMLYSSTSEFPRYLALDVNDNKIYFTSTDLDS